MNIMTAFWDCVKAYNKLPRSSFDTESSGLINEMSTAANLDISRVLKVYGLKAQQIFAQLFHK